MSTLPSGVEEIPIGEFCQTGSGGTPSRSKLSRYFGGTIEVLPGSWTTGLAIH